MRVVSHGGYCDGRQQNVFGMWRFEYGWAHRRSASFERGIVPFDESSRSRRMSMESGYAHDFARGVIRHAAIAMRMGFPKLSWTRKLRVATNVRSAGR